MADKKQQSVAQSRRVTSYPSPANYTLLQLYVEQKGQSVSEVIDDALREFFRGKLITKNPKPV